MYTVMYVFSRNTWYGHILSQCGSVPAVLLAYVFGVFTECGAQPSFKSVRLCACGVARLCVFLRPHDMSLFCLCLRARPNALTLH